jgi:hypothetical protein
VRHIISTPVLSLCLHDLESLMNVSADVSGLLRALDNTAAFELLWSFPSDSHVS